MSSGGAPVGGGPVGLSNEVAIEAWNAVLFNRFIRFRDIVTTGLRLGPRVDEPGRARGRRRLHSC
jgi:hypothetical protein